MKKITLETKLVCGVAAALMLAAGCKKDETSATTSGPTTSSGPGSGGGGTGGAGSGGSGTGANPIEDTPCEDAANAALEVYPADSELQFRHLAKVGTRFMASGYLGYVGFDEDGGNADAAPVELAGPLNTVVNEGDTIGLSSGGENAVAYQRFDAAGPLAGVQVLAIQAPNGVTSGMAGDDAITVWGWNGKLAARVVDASGAIAGDAFDVALGAYNGSLHLSASGKGEEMALAWFGADSGASNQSWFIRLDATGPLSEPRMFHETATRHELNQLVTTNTGYIALITGEAPDNRPEIFMLDDAGAVQGEVGQLVGATLGYGIASQGDAFAVVAGRETGEPQLRVFDLDLEPLGPWVCLGPDHEQTVSAAITTDGSGYAVIYQADNGAVMLSRVDSIGTGAP